MRNFTRHEIEYIPVDPARAEHRQENDLSIRPAWHRKAERVRAHILVCFLTQTLERRQKRVGLVNSRHTILDVLHCIHVRHGDIISFPTADDAAEDVDVMVARGNDDRYSVVMAHKPERQAGGAGHA